MLTSPMKREIRTLHVVVVQPHKRNVLNKCAARAKLLFCGATPFCRSRCRRRRPCLIFLIPNCKLIDASLGPVYMEKSCPGYLEVSLVCSSYPPPLTPLSLGKPTFLTLPYKTWRTVYMRNDKTFAGLEERPVTLFSMVGSPY